MNTRLSIQDFGYLLFELIKGNKALYHVSIGLRKSGIIYIGVIGCYDENRKMGIFALDLMQHMPSLESIKVFSK
jgi:hypothetical protein